MDSDDENLIGNSNNAKNIKKSQAIIRLNDERHIAEMKTVDMSKLKDNNLVVKCPDVAKL